MEPLRPDKGFLTQKSLLLTCTPICSSVFDWRFRGVNITQIGILMQSVAARDGEASLLDFDKLHVVASLQPKVFAHLRGNGYAVR